MAESSRPAAQASLFGCLLAKGRETRQGRRTGFGSNWRQFSPVSRAPCREPEPVLDRVLSSIQLICLTLRFCVLVSTFRVQTLRRKSTQHLKLNFKPAQGFTSKWIKKREQFGWIVLSKPHFVRTIRQSVSNLRSLEAAQCTYKIAPIPSSRH